MAGFAELIRSRSTDPLLHALRCCIRPRAASISIFADLPRPSDPMTVTMSGATIPV
jgi:hypothetical protein